MRQNIRIFGTALWGEIFAIRARESIRKTICEIQTTAFAMCAQEFCAAIVFPTLGEFGDAGFKYGDVHIGAHRRIGFGTYQIMDTR